MIRGGKSRNSAYDPHRIAPEKCGGGELRRRRARHRIRPADCRVFAPGEIVTGQEPDRNRRAPQGREEFPGFPEVVLGIVPAGHERHPDFERNSAGIQPAQVLQYRPVVRSGAFPVHAGIDRFEIEEEQVRPRQEPLEIAPRHIAAGIQRGVDSVVAELPEQRLAELRLKQRFPAGKRDASAGGLVEHPVGGQQPERFRNGDPFSVNPQCAGGTAFHALAAGRAAVPVDGVDPVFEPVSGAGSGALSARQAFRGEERKFRFAADRLRVVAPDAAQGASLQEERRPDAGAVVHGERLDVGENSFGFHDSRFPFICCRLNQVAVLLPAAEVVPEDVPAADPDLQVGVPLRMHLRLLQRLRAENVEMDRMAAAEEIGHQQRTHGAEAVFAGYRRGGEHDIERKIRHEVCGIQLQDRPDHRRDSAAVAAGGGFKGGNVVGQTDKNGEKVLSRPVYPWDLSQSIYKLVGIDINAKLPHPTGCVAYVIPREIRSRQSGGLLSEIMEA